MPQADDLFSAIRPGNDAAFQQRLSEWSGAPLHGLRNGLGQSLAHAVAMFGSPAMVQSLKAAGADLGAKDPGGLTPVQVAAVRAQAAERNLYARSQADTLSSLIEAGAPVPRCLADWPSPGGGRGRVTADRVRACQDQVDRVATELAMADLSRRREGGPTRAQFDRLHCAVSSHPFALTGLDRPVLLPAGAERAANDPMKKVLERFGASRFMVSAKTAKEILSSDQPWNPIQRTAISRADAEAFLQSPAFKQGDAGRLGEIRGMVDAYLDARAPDVQAAPGPHYAKHLLAAGARAGAGPVSAGAPKAAPRSPEH